MKNLVINEWIKIFKRPGTFVMLGLVVLFIVGYAGFQKYEESRNVTDQQMNWKQELETQIASNKQYLQEDGQNNPNLKAFYERQIAIQKYQLQHDLAPVTENHVWTYVTDAQAAISFAGLFTIIIAAGIVASEFSWGTIKLLLVRPISRTKILLSKYITVMLFGLLLLVTIYLLSAIVGLLLFGLPTSDVPHLAYSNGEVVERNLAIHLIGQYLLSSIDILMIATMAFMISAVFRNSSLAIGLSLFLLFMGANVTFLLASRYEWAKYILFANTDLTIYTDGMPPVEGMTIGFSIIVLLVYFIIFHLLAFGVFKQRDVAA
ncbi:ABC-2 type transport system permease protein [Bacillus mesophilus]|uniref:ABC transporter permease n=1 Tax=Bacillus mesophilus TaxID=1808955 RepID=A0A6M0Q459_9BACI|nr:ABC transporter permease [Bacillus mesophilus]MBM7660309.1 ABC-2 type transport system permease protein [Bacillus mesophilus]NEY71022.1 ABC transporter permease [Bacillus mesophilus]